MRDDHDNPFGENRDFTAMAKTDLLKKCCQTSCYAEVNGRGLSCPVATKMFDKEDFHNPFEWHVDMKTKSDIEIRSRCCRPLNKCHTKLNQMGHFQVRMDMKKFPG